MGAYRHAHTPASGTNILIGLGLGLGVRMGMRIACGAAMVVFAALSWRPALVRGSCIPGNAAMDLQSTQTVNRATGAQADIKIAGHTIFQGSIQSGDGVNVAIFGQATLEVRYWGSYAASQSSRLITLLQEGSTGDILALAVQKDAASLSSVIVSYLNTSCGASVASLASGQTYLLVCRKGSGANVLQLFGTPSADGTYPTLAGSVCVSELLSCQNNGLNQILSLFSAGAWTTGYTAEILLGEDYTRGLTAGLFVEVFNPDITVKYNQTTITTATEMIALLNTAIGYSDYLAMAVDTDATAVLLSSSVQKLLKANFQLTKTYKTKGAYIALARKMDTSPLIEVVNSNSPAFGDYCMIPGVATATPVPSYAPTHGPSTPHPTSTVGQTQAPTPALTQAPKNDVAFTITVEAIGSAVLEDAKTDAFVSVVLDTIANISTLQMYSVSAADLSVVTVTFAPTGNTTYLSTDLATTQARLEGVNTSLRELYSVDLSSTFNSKYSGTGLTYLSIISIDHVYVSSISPKTSTAQNIYYFLDTVTGIAVICASGLCLCCCTMYSCGCRRHKRGIENPKSFPVLYSLTINVDTNDAEIESYVPTPSPARSPPQVHSPVPVEDPTAAIGAPVA